MKIIATIKPDESHSGSNYSALIYPAASRACRNCCSHGGPGNAGDPALPPKGAAPPAGAARCGKSRAACGKSNQQRPQFLLWTPALQFLQAWLSRQGGAMKANPWNQNRPFRISRVHTARKPKLLLFVHSLFLGVPGAPASQIRA